MYIHIYTYILVYTHICIQWYMCVYAVMSCVFSTALYVFSYACLMFWLHLLRSYHIAFCVLHVLSDGPINIYIYIYICFRTWFCVFPIHSMLFNEFFNMFRTCFLTCSYIFQCVSYLSMFLPTYFIISCICRCLSLDFSICLLHDSMPFIYVCMHCPISSINVHEVRWKLLHWASWTIWNHPGRTQTHFRKT